MTSGVNCDTSYRLVACEGMRCWPRAQPPRPAPQSKTTGRGTPMALRALISAAFRTPVGSSSHGYPEVSLGRVLRAKRSSTRLAIAVFGCVVALGLSAGHAGASTPQYSVVDLGGWAGRTAMPTASTRSGMSSASQIRRISPSTTDICGTARFTKRARIRS